MRDLDSSMGTHVGGEPVCFAEVAPESDVQLGSMTELHWKPGLPR